LTTVMPLLLAGRLIGRTERTAPSTCTADDRQLALRRSLDAHPSRPSGKKEEEKKEYGGNGRQVMFSALQGGPCARLFC
jgi:hypothetical protein